MARPPRCRFVDHLPPAVYFKPRGVPMSALEEVVLTVDELEALRLADFEGLYHEDAAVTMGVSRQTLGRILAVARKKVAEALVLAKALRIEGGEFRTRSDRAFQCDDCGEAWGLRYGEGPPAECPGCRGRSIHRLAAPQGTPPSRGESGSRGGRIS